jgi:chlorophyllase
MELGDYVVVAGEESYTTGDGSNVTIQTYVPEASGSYPAIVFGHGFMLTPDLYASYGEHLASWGYVVLMPEFPGSMFSPTTHRVLKDYAIELIDWLEGEPGSLTGKVDIGKIGMTGHSLGGKVALLVATEDSRVKAVFGVDAVDAAGGGPMGGGPTADNPSVTPELMGLIDVPFVSLGETLSGEGGGLLSSACAPAEDNYQQYYIHAEGPALEITVLNASHMSFLDNPNCGITCSVCTSGTDDTDMTRALAQRYMTAFFQTTLYEHRGYLGYLTGAAMDTDVADGYVTYVSKNGFGN